MAQILSLICMASFALASITYFKRNHPFSKWRLACIALAFTISAVTVYVQASPSVFQSALASILYSCALMIFYTALHTAKNYGLTVAFSTDLPEKLIRSGPYKWIRNPLYTSYITAQIANLIMASNIITLACTIGLIAILYHAAQWEENKFKHSGIHEEWHEYSRETGMFLPKIKA